MKKFITSRVNRFAFSEADVRLKSRQLFERFSDLVAGATVYSGKICVGICVSNLALAGESFMIYNVLRHRRHHAFLTLTALLAVAACHPVAAPAQEPPVWCDANEVKTLRKQFVYLPSNFAQASLVAEVGRVKAEAIEREMHLQPGWTQAQFSQAEAEERIKKLRFRYGLKPGFTADDWAAGNAQRLLVDFRKQYALKAGFSEQDLRLNLAALELTFKPSEHVGLAKPAQWPLSYDAQISWAGPALADQIAAQYRLPASWSFKDLYDGAGPAYATQYAHWYNLRQDMTHAEIVAALGLASANIVVEKRRLRNHYSVAELMDAAGKSAVAQVRSSLQFPDDQELNEANYMAFMKGLELKLLNGQFKTLPSNFSEADVIASYTAEASEREQQHYDLPSGFTERDWINAYALSWVASFRLMYTLPLNFGEQDLVTEIKKRVARGFCSPLPGAGG